MISVIVPAKDASSTIGECLEALLHQDGMQFGQDYEIIVVDDGSMDHTAEIAEKYATRVIQQPNAGPAAARNAAARFAQGSLLAFTDADCAASPNWLRNLTQPLTDPQIVGVKGTYLTHQTGLVPRFVNLEYEYKDARMRNLPRVDFIDTFSACYRKDIFLQNEGFDESFRIPAVEDIEFSFRLARKGYHMVFKPDASVFHYHDRNIAEYFHRKFGIGYWGAFMLRWTAEKAFTDSHTAPTQRVEIILSALLLATLPFMLIWPIYASLAFLATLLFFVVITGPFQLYIAKRDPQVLWIATGMLFTRAISLGMGLLKGFVRPPKPLTRAFPCQSMAIRAIKRVVDVIGGCFGLILSSPVIVLSAIAIRLDSKGPVIFKQLRAGEFGKPFTIFKLRTMVDGADNMVLDLRPLSHLKGPAFKIPNDPRITRLGRYLRRWSLDELPQFWNVLKGDMSLVGPRPEVLHIVEQYTDDQRLRLIVKPGLTGPVQVNGRGGLDFDQRFQLEMDYLRNYTFLEDIRIVYKTIQAILDGEGIA
jgi:lipopolysaccharide/colanic/teichoic acid biosynthesis glycosyltransferase/glycosyltransferase involved in cell wall biosynthesis